MRNPLSSGSLLRVDVCGSTQDVAGDLLAKGERVGVILAREQTAGRGRFGRTWHSQPGESLISTLIFHDYADHPQPHLIGMALAAAAAGAFYAQVRWPNDLMIGGRKVSGILTELMPDERGRRVPVVGMGVNLNQRSFPPDIEETATSLALAHGGQFEAEQVLRLVLERLNELPEPSSWAALAPIWGVFDKTPGKLYKLPDGKLAVAIGVGSEAQLLCTVDGETRTVLAAEAIFGP